MSRVYLDHAATTPMAPEAVEAMARELGRTGNASSLHRSGRAARRVVEDARELIAERLGARPAEVIFTSGATEADNLAVKGSFWAREGAGRRRVVTSLVEHSAVRESVAWLAGAAGAEVVWLPVDNLGQVDTDALRSVDDCTAVVSVTWASNEVGTVQPLGAVVVAARSKGALVHSDAVQAVSHLPVDFAASGLDMMSVSAHKVGGPYGIGALLARRGVELAPLLHGGGQEREVRSGTLDVAAVAGFAAALEVTVERREREAERLGGLRQDLVAAVREADSGAVVYGPDDPVRRLPGLVMVGFPGCSAEALLMLLDAAGVDVSTGSACSSGVSQPSPVLLAMGVDQRDAASALRLSLGHTSTPEDIAALAATLPPAVRRARAAAAVA